MLRACPSFPPDPQASKAVQPRKAPLDHPAVGTQPRAMPCAAPGDGRHDAALEDLRHDRADAPISADGAQRRLNSTGPAFISTVPSGWRTGRRSVIRAL